MSNDPSAENSTGPEGERPQPGQPQGDPGPRPQSSGATPAPPPGATTPTAPAQPVVNGAAGPQDHPAAQRPWPPQVPAQPGPRWAPAPVQENPGWFKKGFGLGAGGALGAGLVLLVLSLLGSILTGLVMAGIMSAFGGDDLTAKDTAYETVWGKDEAKNTLRAIDVRGAIMASGSDGMGLTASTYGYEVADLIDEIGKDDAAGLVLRMDTPGGTINGSRAIGEAVERYQERTGHKVVAVVEGMSASGGMFAMVPADKVIADHGTLVGSIGVISGPFERYRDVKAIDGGILGGGVTTTGGITSEYITQGKGKDFGNPWRDMTAEERRVWTAGLQNEYAQFVSWVSKHRGIPEATIRNTLGAHLFDADTAKKHKLVDDVMGRDEAYREAARLNGVDPADTKLVAPTAPSAFEQLLGAEARTFGQAPAAVGDEATPARASSVICTGAPQVLAWHGPTTQLCGR